MDYKQKYLKYKSKYLELKLEQSPNNMIGGNYKFDKENNKVIVTDSQNNNFDLAINTIFKTYYRNDRTLQPNYNKILNINYEEKNNEFILTGFNIVDYMLQIKFYPSDFISSLQRDDIIMNLRDTGKDSYIVVKDFDPLAPKPKPTPVPAPKPTPVPAPKPTKQKLVTNCIVTDIAENNESTTKLLGEINTECKFNKETTELFYFNNMLYRLLEQNNKGCKKYINNKRETCQKLFEKDFKPYFIDSQIEMIMLQLEKIPGISDTQKNTMIQKMKSDAIKKYSKENIIETMMKTQKDNAKIFIDSIPKITSEYKIQTIEIQKKIIDILAILEIKNNFKNSSNKTHFRLLKKYIKIFDELLKLDLNDPNEIYEFIKTKIAEIKVIDINTELTLEEKKEETQHFLDNLNILKNMYKI